MKKIIIGVDGNEANVVHKVGVSVYTLRLLEYFQAHASEEIRFIIYLRNVPSDDLPSETPFFKYRVVWGPALWSQLFLPIRLIWQKLIGDTLNVFFSPAHYIPRLCPFKTVVTIHDLSYLFFPNEFLKKDLYQLKNWTLSALRNATAIVAVSKTTKKDIMHEYTIPDKKITVIYNGYESTHKKSTIKNQKKLDYPYFLYVGTIQPRKNLGLLISAFTEFHTTHPDFKLVIAGKKGWLYESIFKQVAELKMDKYIIFLGFITDEEKNELYRSAAAFILPSLYEGFGIPLLEAMSHECPVLSSFSSSLPEIGGEACLYFDPQDYHDLVEKMNAVIIDTQLTKRLVISGKKRISTFSWEETGKNTLHILQSISE